MRMMIILLIAMVVSPVFAAKRDLSDHPLLSAYKGSTASRKDVKQFDEYQLITATDKEMFSGPVLEGKVTRIIYRNPKERSILEMYRNYEAALQKAGVEILFQCNQKKRECIERYAGRTFQEYSGIHSISNLDGRFMSGKVVQENQTAYVAVAVGRTSTDIHVIEIRNMETEMVTLNAMTLKDNLTQKGYVIVEGVYFDTDKTTLKPESKPALVEVAKLLTNNSDMKLFVVGHTDSHGAFSHNMTLSKGRAKAVVESLTSDYLIAADRLEPHGVGPLAPKANNNTNSGRAMNRRVVLVSQ